MLLEGVKVIEYATYVAGPGAGGVLCEWGAEVIKIEPPSGDPIRKVLASSGTESPVNPMFDFDNRGKKSIQLDTTTEEGHAALLEMVKDADVFLTNMRSGPLKRSRLDYEVIKAVNPKIVYCALTGYGLDGPDAEIPGFDITAFWARSGVAHLTIPKGEDPFPLRTAFGDHVASLNAAGAISAALLQAERKGVGELIDVSLLKTAHYAMASDYVIQLYFGRIASTKSRFEATNPLSTFYKTKDDKWLVLVERQGNVDWPCICRALDMDHLIDDENYNTGKARRKTKAELARLMDQAFSSYTMEDMAKRLDAENLTWAPLNSVGDAMADAQAEAIGAFAQMPKRDGGSYKTLTGPVRFPLHDEKSYELAPLAGEHSREVLLAAGLDDEAIDVLVEKGIVKEA